MGRMEVSVVSNLFLLFSCCAFAEQDDSSVELLAMANMKCAAFYAAAQAFVEPEAKRKLGSNFVSHYSSSHQLSASYGEITEIFNTELVRQVEELSSLKGQEQISNYLAKNATACSGVLDASLGSMQEMSNSR